MEPDRARALAACEIIAAYAQFNAAEAENFKPKLVYLGERNKVERTSNTIPVQVA